MTTTKTTTRQDHTRRLVALYPTDPALNVDALVGCAGGRAYLLVERAVRDGYHWVSLHDSPADAATYHLNQEARENWEPLLLADLDSGVCHAPVYALDFRPAATIGEMGA